ncbi:SDR family oxidoreductase [Agrobacterium radiobacter]|jgi:gluconate 5-dehydrogenase|uniref:Gluconate 5-dehydrogenase n=1 Tax=Agrobacterium tumefaciens str. B6 TaxID=1183423 RepID=A0A822V249_AGRTU|nr:SDR family oxidoreductase [Agrobacterium tumefaciens]AYM06299.1 gluconate 5-dehydrogenase [Agrobacterium tumefaciens]KWT83335.1 gluconate 5-dehydrogenase [Agrobacterium tumefaciens str. B6]MQB27000.1 SDR family oxidoreductase [Agrobacterium tumefaciens]NSZ33122.1 SDR family oxidoreductase [Agrobacterium tumefaciens]NTA05748.1 SDR family oxidoreductase [Agrobacterium tumefaciens]
MGILRKFSLENRIAVITGSGRGLGFEIAKAFAEAGAHVWLTGRNAQTLEEAADTLRNAGGKADYAAFDIADTAAGSALVRRIMDEFGHLDILVNNVGARDRRPLAEFSDDDVLELIRTDLTSSVSLSRDAAQAMNANGYGRIITITSILGHIVRPGDAIYPVAKQGLTGLMRAIAVEYGARGITSNAIAPGMFATETNAALAENPDMVAFAKLRVPLERWGRPDEIAGAALFLASDASSFVNGHVLTVDGGMSVRL